MEPKLNDYVKDKELKAESYEKIEEVEHRRFLEPKITSKNKSMYTKMGWTAEFTTPRLLGSWRHSDKGDYSTFMQKIWDDYHFLGVKKYSGLYFDLK